MTSFRSKSSFESDQDTCESCDSEINLHFAYQPLEDESDVDHHFKHQRLEDEYEDDSIKYSKSMGILCDQSHRSNASLSPSKKSSSKKFAIMKKWKASIFNPPLIIL